MLICGQNTSTPLEGWVDLTFGLVGLERRKILSLIGLEIGWLGGWLVGRLGVGRWVGWLVGWFVGGWIDWLFGILVSLAGWLVGGWVHMFNG